ncbi:Mitochondrial import inner membrane translocase subunit tim17 tim22 tim23 family protein isoform 1 [Balamuthia mandrillaris]
MESGQTVGQPRVEDKEGQVKSCGATLSDSEGYDNDEELGEDSPQHSRRRVIALDLNGIDPYSPSQALHTFVRSFTVAFSIRFGISLALRALKLGQKRKTRSLLSINELLSEKKLVVRVDAVRVALTFAAFTGGHKLLYGLLKRWRGKNDPWNAVISGFVSGFALLFEKKQNRRTIALYLLTRLAQCVYNDLKERGWFTPLFKWLPGKHKTEGSWPHGDSLLFILTSAQVMYAYVMRPDTLPPAYRTFIVRTGPTPEVVLENVRRCCRGIPVDIPALTSHFYEVMTKLKLKDNIVTKTLPVLPTFLEAQNKFPSAIPCALLHPSNPSCSSFFLETFLSTARKILPLYATLTFVPLLIFKFKRFLQFNRGFPVQLVLGGVLSWLRSTAFLALFCSGYQAIICSHRNIFSRDHKFLYFFAGILCSLSIFLEKKSRRSELALYVFPRALDSLYMQLLDRKWMASVPHGDLLIFCVAMGGLMHYYHNRPQTMSPLLRYVLRYLHKPKPIPVPEEEDDGRRE